MKFIRLLEILIREHIFRYYILQTCGPLNLITGNKNNNNGNDDNNVFFRKKIEKFTFLKWHIEAVTAINYKRLPYVMTNDK